MKSEIQIDNNAGVCQIDIEGTIGVPEEWQFDRPEARVATYEKFRDAVRRIAEIDASEVVVNIRSTGGDVNDALLIHDALRQLPARVTTRCYGYTASAATIIAQAASEGCRLLSANALYLIHTAICSTEGNAAEIAGKIDLLHQTDARIAAVYASRSGRPAAEFEALMAENNGNGRWLSPEEAVGAGLADRVTDEAGGVSALTRNLARGWERLLCGIGLLMLSAGMAALALLSEGASTFDIGWRMALCGAGFGFFQSPNLKALMTSAPLARSGGASGIVAISRLLGQTLGASLVALCFHLSLSSGPQSALWLGCAFALVGAVASGLRLVPYGKKPL